MRIAYVLITHLRAKAELHRHRHLKDSPVVIAENGKPLVVDSSVGASVRTGMTLTQAMSYHRDAIILHADEPYYRSVFNDVVDALLQVNDRVEADQLGTAYARLDGMELLYGSEYAAANALYKSLPSHLRARVGVSGSKFASLTAARLSAAPGVAVCPTDTDTKAFLAPLSIALLPLSAHIKEQLHRFGIHTMGAVASLGRRMLTDRFGHEGRLAWELSNGIDTRPVVPTRRPTPIEEYASLPFSSTSTEMLTAAMDVLLQRAFTRPLMQHRLVDSIKLIAGVHDDAPWTQTVHFRDAIGSWQDASRLLRVRVEAQPPEAPVDDITLHLHPATAEYGRQLGLLDGARDSRRHRLADMDSRLRTRLNGAAALHRIIEVSPGHPIPEMRAMKASLAPGFNDEFTPLHTPQPIVVRETNARLPLSVQLKQRWLDVLHIDDLWLFDLWWLPEPVSRRYVIVRDARGGQLALFRDEYKSCWYTQPLSAA